MSETALVRTTFGSEATAHAVGTQLVEERLAACVTITSGATSIYRWKGVVEQAVEAVTVFKTSVSRADALRTRLEELHDYALPVIETWSATTSEAAGEWIRNETHA